MRRIRSIRLLAVVVAAALPASASLATVAVAATPGSTSASATTPSWAMANPAHVPPAAGPTAFDPATGQLVMYQDSAFPSQQWPDCASQATWTWDGADWTNHQMTDPPEAHDAPALGYDGATKQVLMFGGYHEPSCAASLGGTGWEGEDNDTWVWTGARWTELHPAASPDQREGACTAYDATSGQFILSGGWWHMPTTGGAQFDDTWQWANGNWAKLSPATTPTAGPCAMTYDPVRGVIVMVVDQLLPAINLQVWIWNGVDWSHAADVPNSVGSPAQVAFDAETGTSIVYTGAKETWSWNGTVWAQAGAVASPDAGAQSYDAATHQLVMIGAVDQSSTPKPTTWVYAADGSSSVTPSRLAGVNRQATAVAVSQSAFAGNGSASAVVLARADVFADALAGGPLAAAKHAPLLLTSSGLLDDVTKAEIQRVLPSGGTVYLLGGTAALSDDVAAAVTALGDVPTRLAGADRFATAVAIADEMGDPATVFEASGTNFPDALSAVPAAVASHGVILLTNGSSQARATSAYLTAHATTRYAVGGPAEWADPTAIGLAGADRYSTSEAVALAFFPAAEGVSVASGQTFPDALAAGPVAGAKNEPVLLVPATGALPSPVSTYLGTHAGAVTSVQAFGGAAAVADSVLAEIATALH